MKVTAITVSACVALLSVLATQYPNDPYFFIVSSSLVGIVLRLALTALFILMTFRNKFYTIYGHKIAAGLAVLLVGFGIAGLTIMPLTYYLFTYLKPLDFIFMIGMGNVFGLMSLTYRRGTRRLDLPRLTRPRSQERLLSPNRA